jgi:hypothetical protein
MENRQRSLYYVGRHSVDFLREAERPAEPRFRYFVENVESNAKRPGRLSIGHLQTDADPMESLSDVLYASKHGHFECPGAAR